MACNALGIAAKEYLQAERAVCLWLVPSNTIREQTLAALRIGGTLTAKQSTPISAGRSRSWT